MRRSLLLVGCALAGFVLTGCVPESENPITPLAEAKQDAQLNGLWSNEDEETVRYVHVGAELEKPVVAQEDPEPGLMRLWIVTHRKGDDKQGLEKPAAMRFFVSQARDNNFMNVVLPMEEDGAKGKPAGPTKYYFVKYKVDGDQLAVWGMDFQAAASAVENGELGGTVTRDGKELKSVQLTDSSEHLMVYLAGGGADKLFPEKAKTVLRRVR